MYLGDSPAAGARTEDQMGKWKNQNPRDHLLFAQQSCTFFRLLLLLHKHLCSYFYHLAKFD